MNIVSSRPTSRSLQSTLPVSSSKDWPPTSPCIAAHKRHIEQQVTVYRSQEIPTFYLQFVLFSNLGLLERQLDLLIVEQYNLHYRRRHHYHHQSNQSVLT